MSQPLQHILLQREEAKCVYCGVAYGKLSSLPIFPIYLVVGEWRLIHNDQLCELVSRLLVYWSPRQIWNKAAIGKKHPTSPTCRPIVQSIYRCSIILFVVLSDAIDSALLQICSVRAVKIPLVQVKNEPLAHYRLYKKTLVRAQAVLEDSRLH